MHRLVSLLTSIRRWAEYVAAPGLGSADARRASEAGLGGHAEYVPPPPY